MARNSLSEISSSSRTPISAPSFGVRGRTSNGQRSTDGAFIVLISLRPGGAPIVPEPLTVSDRGVDSHCHVFDMARFPFAPEATYRPPEHEQGTVAQFSAVLDAHRLSHALLVSPTSGYFYDNRCMVAA